MICKHCQKKRCIIARGLCFVCYRDIALRIQYPPTPARPLSARKMCVHCGKKPGGRPRGLCWSCYYTPEIVALYPSQSKFARRGVPECFCDKGLAPRPTSAMPGSPEKEAVLGERARLGYALWHPMDAGGRSRRDDNHGSNFVKHREEGKRLSEEEKADLRRLFHKGERPRDLIQLFGISKTTLYLVVKKGKQTEPDQR